MCGISGFNWQDERLARGMVRVQEHRGPDAEGIFVDGGVSLGHNRLSVIDLSAEANQPMHDGPDELVITYNGEIYNFRELKKELEGEYAFKTQSDTEVILAGYRKWGEGVAGRLNGMFAFAIWDKRKKELFCARDHAGMKPFYYFWDGERFIFASEPRTLLLHDVPRTLNKKALSHYFRVLYTPHDQTLIKNIYKLPPAHTLRVKDKALEVRPYPALAAQPRKLSYKQAVSAVRAKTEAAVKRHVIADVPVGVYLSGGIDSSVMLATATKLGGTMKAFTIGFELGAGEEVEKFNADLELAKKTAAHFGAEHTIVRLSADEALRSMEDAAAHNSDPISNPTAVAMFLLAREAKKRVTVVLTGNGGDELFGGYDRYRMALAAHYYKKLPRFVRVLLNHIPRLAKLDQSAAALFAQFLFQKDKELSPVLRPGLLEPAHETQRYYAERYVAGADAADMLMRADERSWLPDHFFMLSDKMSMASALEERMPLLDIELKALAHSLPRGYKTTLFGTKRVLKDAFRDLLPSYLLNQPKRGWFSPAAKWLRHEPFQRAAAEILSPEYCAETRDLFNWPEVAKMLEQHISKERYNLTVLWALIAFQLWAKQNQIKS